MSDTVKIRKANRIIHVAAGRLNSYLAQGYDQINEKGEVIKGATAGKTVPVAELNKVAKENEALRQENQQLKEDLVQALEEAKAEDKPTPKKTKKSKE